MIDQIAYCERWLKNVPPKKWLWTPQKANLAHDSRNLYTAVIGDLETPDYIMEFSLTHVGYIKIDKMKRRAASHRFSEVSPGVLFLTMMTHMLFHGDSDSPKQAFSLIFKEDGKVYASEKLYTPQIIERNAQSTADISDHYLPYPAFGNYNELQEFAQARPIVPEGPV